MEKKLNESKKPITVLAHGCFDILHAGHLAYFKEAKSYGDRLIVTLTSDRFVNKGPGRPYFNENTRAEMLRSLKIIDHVEIIDDQTALPAIHKFKPDFYVKGQDYKDKSKDVTGGIFDEELAVKEYGGRLVFTECELDSSSRILNKFFIERTPEQMLVIEQVKELGGIEKIRSLMADIAKLKVSVIGEPILDIYRFVEPKNISSKYPCISAEFINEETYLGGSLAIENHLRSFCDLRESKYIGAAPRKIRYISQDKQQRIFEVTEIDQNIKVKPFDKDLDCYILADFGHGLFDYQLLKDCEEIKGFVGLNVQTNSSNFGFNTFQKHKRWDYLVLDKRELQLAYHTDKGLMTQYMREIENSYPTKTFSVTFGSLGATYAPDETGMNRCDSPAFADQVVDTTGAGDAYFAITSLLVKVNAPPIFIPFIGNVFAGLKTKIIGNKSAVSKASLMKALESLLK